MLATEPIWRSIWLIKILERVYENIIPKITRLTVRSVTYQKVSLVRIVNAILSLLMRLRTPP